MRVTLSDASVHTVTAEVPILNGIFYYLVGGRLGNAIFLRVHAALSGLETVPGLSQATASSAILSLTPCTPPGDLLQIGGLPFNDIHNDCILDECAIYDYALSEARIIAHHTAAINALDVRLTANILTSAQIDGTVEPDPVAYPFRHNWSQPVLERLRWKTSTFKPINGSIDTARQRSALRRQVEYQHLLSDESLRRRFEARSFGGRKTYVQFEPDKVRLGSLLLAASTSLSLDFTYLDFETDHYALFYESDTKYEYKQLTNATNSLIEWDGNLTQDYAAHAYIKPARIARLSTSQDLELHTDTIGETSTIYEYLPEDEPLNPRRTTPWISTLTYQSEEAFDLAEWQGHDYSEKPKIEFIADREELDYDTGVVSTKQYRWGAHVVSPYRMILQGRETIAKYLGWIYERTGMNTPFWMPTFRNNLEYVSRSGNDLTVSGHEYTNLYANADNRIDLAFVYFDNTTIMRRINSSTLAGANDLLSLNTIVPTPTNLRYLCFLRRVTLVSDDLEIAWETDSVVTVAFAVVDAP